MSAYLAAVDRDWIPLAEPIAARLEAMGALPDGGTNRWHVARAASLRAGVAARVAECGEQALILSCGCGEALRPRRCKAHKACSACASAKWRMIGEDVGRSLAHAYEVAHDDWRARGRPAMWEPRLALLTLSVAHSGSMTDDLRLLTRAWGRWRAWLLRQPGISAAPAFARVAEYTDSDGGHTHHHVAAILPWIDYHAARAAWERATEGAGSQWDCKSRRWAGGAKAARYLAKYVAKGPTDHAPGILARWLAATYMQRLITASRHFWRRLPRTCDCCGSRYALEWIQPPWMGIDELERYIYERMGRDPPHADSP